MAILHIGADQIIGSVNGGMERLDHPIYQGELNAIYILESHQRKGIGRELARIVAKRLSQIEIHSMLVWVLADNPACCFYEKLGGKKVNQKEIKRGIITSALSKLNFRVNGS